MGKVAWKRIVPVGAILALPVMATAWSSHRAMAMRDDLNLNAMTEEKDYRGRALERFDRERRLVLGAKFPWSGSDIQGRPMVIGRGWTTVVFFANACTSCQASEPWKDLARHFSKSQIITIFVDSPDAVKSVARVLPDARLHFVADPRGQWHQAYGANSRRAFVMDGNGLIIDKLGPWSRADEFNLILQQRQHPARASGP